MTLNNAPVDETTLARTADAHASPITVAINTQINPRTAGGVETALNALIAGLGRLDVPDRFLLLALEVEVERP